MTNSPDSVTEALDLLRQEGYTTDFSVHNDVLECSACQVGHAPRQGIIERQFRFEGASNPDDQAIVLGVHCPQCDERGVLVSAYGPSAEPDVFDWLTKAGGLR